MKRQRKPHPIYAAVHSTWSRLFTMPGVDHSHVHRQLLVEIATTARELLRSRVRKAKHHARLKLDALLDLDSIYLAHHGSPAQRVIGAPELEEHRKK